METGTGGVEGEQTKEEPEKSVGGIGAVEDDLTLRAALYGVLFQSYTDKVGSFLGWGVTPGGVEGKQTKEEPKISVGGLGVVEDDLTLRAAL